MTQSSTKNEKTTLPDMPFPPWVVRRLRQQAFGFAQQSHQHLSQCHLHWLGRAWMVAGPHVPVPPCRYTPGILHLLGRLSLESSLMEGWLLDLATSYARTPRWRCRKEFTGLCIQLQTKKARWYWQWLCSVIRQRTQACAEPFDEWAREVVAARVAARLYRNTDLAGLVSRIDQWKNFTCDRPTKACMFPDAAFDGIPGAPLVASCNLSSDTVSIRHLHRQMELVEESEAMNHCASRHYQEVRMRKGLFFSLRECFGSKGTLLLRVHGDGRWYVAELKGENNAAIGRDTAIGTAANHIRSQLDRCGAHHPLLAEYLQVVRDEAAERSRHEQATASDLMLHHFVPGLGKSDASREIQRFLDRCGQKALKPITLAGRVICSSIDFAAKLGHAPVANGKNPSSYAEWRFCDDPLTQAAFDPRRGGIVRRFMIGPTDHFRCAANVVATCAANQRPAPDRNITTNVPAKAARHAVQTMARVLHS